MEKCRAKVRIDEKELDEIRPDEKISDESPRTKNEKRKFSGRKK